MEKHDLATGYRILIYHFLIFFVLNEGVNVCSTLALYLQTAAQLVRASRIARGGSSLDLGPQNGLRRPEVAYGHRALHAIVRPDLLAHDVVPDDAAPRVTHGEVVVEFRRTPLQCGQPRPRHVAKVVVLVVVADVPPRH